jgi:hypothetical protein
MSAITAKLRWFPLGPIEGPKESIKKKDLDNISKQHRVSISLEEVRHAVQEGTRGRPIEKITQHIVTISTDDEEAFRSVIRALVKKYRAPRTTYATLGSDERARRMMAELFDEEDGWY